MTMGSPSRKSMQVSLVLGTRVCRAGLSVDAARSQISSRPSAVTVPSTVELLGDHCRSATSSLPDCAPPPAIASAPV
jgi:hypothetical protein